MKPLAETENPMKRLTPMPSVVLRCHGRELLLSRALEDSIEVRVLGDGPMALVPHSLLVEALEGFKAEIDAERP